MTNGKKNDAASAATQKSKETVATTERTTVDYITTTSEKPDEVANTKDLKLQNPHEDTDIMVKNDNSNQPSGFRFMDLAAEVRLIIIEYALMTSAPMIFLVKFEECSRFYNNAFAGRAINQIQDVSKQLRVESEYVEMKSHKVVADGPDFVELIRMTKGRFQAFVREVTLTPFREPYFRYKNPDEFVLHPLIDLCLSHKHARVQVRLHDLNFNGKGSRTISTFLNLATVIMQALRGKGKYLYSSGSEMVAKWQRRKSIEQLNAQHLLFFPCDKVLDEQRFRSLFKRIRADQQDFIFQHFGLNSLNELIEEVQDWYNSGL
jgi:hypothetical protein